MSSEIAIQVENLSKCYQIYDKPRDRLMQMLMRGYKQFFREFWAVRDVSFDIKKGETVGIVGKNGSGKSTLLQMICGTLNPTAGNINVHGRVAALLELGSGFNPEFTGRENVYMNAAILGLSKDETDSRYQEITDFADIGEFIDQPVKSYSSGMLVRLAFAVAINVDPDVLIVDEALAVGDELFQRKCFSRIEEIKKKGATILFVSHAGSTIVELCDSAILLDAGELLCTGKPKAIVARYQKLLYAPDDKRDKIRREIKAQQEIFRSEHQSPEPAANATSSVPVEEPIESYDPHLKPNSTIEYESHGAHIAPPSIQTIDGRQVNNLIRRKRYRYCYSVHFSSPATHVRFGMVIRTKSGISLGGAMSASTSNVIPFVEAGTTISVEFNFDCLLNPGTYFMNAGVFGKTQQDEAVLHRLVDALAFRVPPVDENLSTELVDFGCVANIEIHE